MAKFILTVAGHKVLGLDPGTTVDTDTPEDVNLTLWQPWESYIEQANVDRIMETIDEEKQDRSII